MALPLVPLALAAGAALVVYEFLIKPKASSTSTSCALPDDVAASFRELLSSPTALPGDLNVIADKLDAYGCAAEAKKARARAVTLANAPAALPTVAPAASAPTINVNIPPIPPLNVPLPTPFVAPPEPSAPEPEPQPVPVAPQADSMPIMTFVADARPMSDASAYYNVGGKHAKIDVRQEAKALRFLGYDAGDPGYSGNAAADQSQGLGSWSPKFQAAARAYQSEHGLTADGWVGPGTIGQLAKDVAQRNLANVAQNRASNVPDAVFSGSRVLVGRYSGHGVAVGLSHGRGVTMGAVNGPSGKITTPKEPRAVRFESALRLRKQPTDAGRTVLTAPKGGKGVLVQHVSGPKREAASSGPGGWALVAYENTRGWVPAEWLTLL